MKTNRQQIHFIKSDAPSELNPLKEEWQRSLTAPQDGMWEAFANYADHWAINDGSQNIGYACVDDEGRLLQFFIQALWLPAAPFIFEQFLKQLEITKGLIGTNNPFALSLGMHLQKSVTLDTYLFTDMMEVETSQFEGKLAEAKEEDLEKLIDFCHESMGGPKDWLEGYLGNLISRAELFFLESAGEILGTCEVRKSESDQSVADVGMVVSHLHRRKGLGTFLLGKAKEIAIGWKRKPICSCEKGNIGSLKSIHNNGFRSIHQMLLFEF